MDGVPEMINIPFLNRNEKSLQRIADSLERLTVILEQFVKTQAQPNNEFTDYLRKAIGDIFLKSED